MFMHVYTCTLNILYMINNIQGNIHGKFGAMKLLKNFKNIDFLRHSNNSLKWNLREPELTTAHVLRKHNLCFYIFWNLTNRWRYKLRSPSRVSFDMRSDSNYTSGRQLAKLDRKTRQDNPKEVKLLYWRRVTRMIHVTLKNLTFNLPLVFEREVNFNHLFCTPPKHVPFSFTNSCLVSKTANQVMWSLTSL